jgi:hypothetical protein
VTYDFGGESNDPDMILLPRLKTFGEDGNVLVLGLQDSSVYKLGNCGFAGLDTLARIEA